MSDLVKELMSANERGVSPPQDWTHRAIDEICRQQAEIERLNARIKDYQDACTQKQEIINGYKELETAIRQDQIEKDENEFIHLLDAMIESTIKNFTDSMIPVQQLNSVKGQVKFRARLRKFFPEPTTKQAQGDI